MIACLILAVGIIPLFLVFSRGSAGTIMNRDDILAHSHASEMLDYAVALGYQKVPAGDLSPNQLGNLSPCESRFTRTLNVQEIQPSGGWGNWPMSYKVLTARVNWESQGVRKNFALSGLLYQGFSPSQ